MRGTTLPPMHTFNDSTDATRAAVYGLGAVSARKHSAQPYLQRYELVRLPGPTLKARYAYYIVHPSHRALSPAAALFIDWLKREALDERTPMPALPAELVTLPPSEGVREPRVRRLSRKASAAQ
ncbi:TPA: transcriptional regulator [Xanthomonas vasicola pv. zeae]|uniref:Transcriptional regulator n=2 Tax=Xanthomonas vasicola pv. vasculorum TaxID=325776 RepID=A0A836ZRL0_XANVA|nr:transcriptional regulator [Xanthomonas vasicola pv. vasculorum]KEZ98180.1 transcriptional regulator [Xanthomonas vasicola pv. vasculorum NCPPB 895]KFA25035.1 transcriptional regulator [Xanthomonas vasicola pv. vasculorum NCPPB 1326]KFA28224.1 transcriptional regulator [Xanthomonas vasicola pv. vasculorum NCPPB 1381]KFA33128.1 transcriptional regulator [Xanthomonas vasicola pv. vasculorum NCPPB 206]MBV6742057.1 transcriptional regulator [Xanthomonas vasicola pv. musacearum NCPPB 2251]MBV674